MRLWTSRVKGDVKVTPWIFDLFNPRLNGLSFHISLNTPHKSILPLLIFMGSGIIRSASSRQKTRHTFTLGGNEPM